MKLVHLATAPNQTVAELWVDCLRDAGIPSMVRPGDTASFLGVSAAPCRVLVDEASVEEARTVLGEVGE